MCLAEKRPGTLVRIAFVSCNPVDWGGSEELWARAALELSKRGVEIAVAKPNLVDWPEPIQTLRSQGVALFDLWKPMHWRLRNLAHNASYKLMQEFERNRLKAMLKSFKPDLVVLSQGGSWDGLRMQKVFHAMAVPYALICQKGTDLYWPSDDIRPALRDFAQDAAHVFTVSQHNLTLFEEQIGQRLENASVVRNPFLVDYDSPQPWPEDDETVRFACIGRLYACEKGQDILLRVLARDHWRSRALHVDFYGQGANARGLKDMARLLGVENVSFHGHSKQIEKVWETHHGLVLPSRAEGLPLVLVETMLVGRVPIISTAGGSAEIVVDNETGFLMNGFDEDGLDEAMERAWQARQRWPEMAAAAAKSVRTHVPRSPAQDLAQRILSLSE